MRVRPKGGFEMRKAVIVRSLLAALVLGLLALGYSGCGKSYSSPTSPPMSGTPTPGPPPTPNY
jgi:hypothetical protein